MTVLLGIDDTDMPDTPGTGRIARTIAARLSSVCSVTGVTRHQLLVHPDIPYTSHNSCAVIHCEGADAQELFSIARDMVNERYVKGSDPGIAAADSSNLGPSVTAFGLDAKRIILTQQQARSIADNQGILLEGVGGTSGGMIGALAGIGLASTGNDGRYVQRGMLRNLSGSQEASALLHHGVDLILTAEGRPITEGCIYFRKFPKPSLIGGKAVLFVTHVNGFFQEIIRD